jgi:very-short-patch-repair endonuclease
MQGKYIWYNPCLKEKARSLRNNSTKAEILLWNQLKRKQFNGFDFHRQKPIDQFIVDFFCHKLMLAIEIDGESHIDKEDDDVARQLKLETLGIHFLRFSNEDVLFNMDNVLRCIQDWIENRK